MILLPCPWCGPRDASEFGHVGETPPRPDPRTATPAQWRAYLYLRDNTRGWVAETWYHRMGCRRYIRVERHTQTNETRPVPLEDAAGVGEGAGAVPPGSGAALGREPG